MNTPDLATLAAKVDDLAALELGQSFAAGLARIEAELDAARVAVEVAHDADRAALIEGQITPTSADIFAARSEYLSHLPADDAAIGYLLDIHARSLASWPELARSLRTPEIVAHLVAVGEAGATVRAQKPAERGLMFKRRYLDGLAEQLAALGEDNGVSAAARDYQEIAALAERVAIVRQRHEDHAAAELEQAEQERRAAEAERKAADRERVREAMEAAKLAEAEAKRLHAHAHQIRVEILSARLRAHGRNQTGRDGIRVAGHMYGIDAVLAQIPRSSSAFLDAVEEALDG